MVVRPPMGYPFIIEVPHVFIRHFIFVSYILPQGFIIVLVGIFFVFTRG